MEFTNKKILIIAVAVLLVSAVIVFALPEKKSNIDSGQATQQELDSLVIKVGKLMVLPVGETPTIATIVDPSKLNDNKFFANAREGDRLLLYPISKMAILYNPGENKIIEVGPFTLEPTPTPPPSSAATSTKNTKN